MKIAIYSAVMENYDSIEDISELARKYPEIHFIMFSDIKKITPGWDWQESKIDDKLNSIQKSRYHKWLPHIVLGSKYDITVWIDGCMHNLNIPLIKKYINQVKNNKTDFIVSKHPDRTNIITEIKEITRQKKDILKIMINQYKRCLKEGFKDDIGLFETNILIRNHKAETNRIIGENVWKEIQNGSTRDQISLPFVLWKYKIKKYSIIEWELKEKMADWQGHGKRKKKRKRK